MIRKRGYSLRGQTIAIRGDFQRKPKGTFNRGQFFTCCRDFAYLARGHVCQYPGSNSAWIMDGASIHRDPEIIHFLRSIGIVPIFLPAYCPFFNLIEFMIGYIKQSFKRHYNESSGNDLLPFVVETFERFVGFNMSRVFNHCGWKLQGVFDPTGPMSKETRQTGSRESSRSRTDEECETLDFMTRELEAPEC
ncbi:hypothetical protein JG687_00017710 [Phytophthora cactorum]|uniref:Tc1-like transposase DDE domain-containing protein n=1 Tax=Phytophthora cactorum TaxID=29920 RepID=A0A8T1TSJ6_9STRA|nr:hypothetical protein JG687_00017710 [Phytophthora cactorum]